MIFICNVDLKGARNVCFLAYLKLSILSFPLQIPNNTIVIRPSMVKVKADPELCQMKSLSSLEIVNTRYVWKYFEFL